jgi:Ca-activated chloride channel homolog
MRTASPAGGSSSGCPQIILRLLPLFFLLPAPGVFAQTESPPKETATSEATISVDVDLVVLQATVRDKKGGFVSGLEKRDFQVFENGDPQAIHVFQHEDVPVAVGLIVDNSGSMSRKRKDVTAAALAFVKSSNRRDEMFVVNFNERVSFGLPDTRLFSASPAELEAALNGVPARGMTAVYDAIDAGLDHLKKATLDKKVLIVISDGGDNASRHTLEQVLESAGRSDVMIYTIGLFDEDDEDRNPGVLRKIARATGGEVFLPKETSEVVPICERIAEDIRNQYTIGYAPSNRTLDSAYRTIRVTATGRHNEKYTVRTRTGYIASSEGKESPGTHNTPEGKLP